MEFNVVIIECQAHFLSLPHCCASSSFAQSKCSIVCLRTLLSVLYVPATDQPDRISRIIIHDCDWLDIIVVLLNQNKHATVRWTVSGSGASSSSPRRLCVVSSLHLILCGVYATSAAGGDNNNKTKTDWKIRNTRKIHSTRTIRILSLKWIHYNIRISATYYTSADVSGVETKSAAHPGPTLFYSSLQERLIILLFKRFTWLDLEDEFLQWHDNREVDDWVTWE